MLRSVDGINLKDENELRTNCKTERGEAKTLCMKP